MNVGCTIAGHAADHAQVYNSGYYFSACRRCGLPLLRSAHDDWRPVPSGHRVVWKSGPGSHSLDADYSGVLPVALDPAVPRRPRRLTGRALIRTSPAKAAIAIAGPGEEAFDDHRHPRLLLAALFLGAGIKLVLDFTLGR